MRLARNPASFVRQKFDSQAINRTGLLRGSMRFEGREIAGNEGNQLLRATCNISYRLLDPPHLKTHKTLLKVCRLGA